MMTTLIAVLATIPIGIIVNLITPPFKSRLSIHAKVRRTRRIKRIQENLREVQIIRSGGQTNQLIARTTAAILRVIGFAAFGLITELSRIILYVTYALKSPPNSAPFAVPRGAVSILLEVLLIWFLIALIGFSYTITDALRWTKRLYDDSNFGTFKELAEGKLKRFNNSTAEVPEEKVGEAKVETKAGSSSLVIRLAAFSA